MRFIIVIMQLQFTIATNCIVLTSFMNVSYVVGHERVASHLFQCVMCILRVLTIL
jgi:hypothetical protein